MLLNGTMAQGRDSGVEFVWFERMVFLTLPTGLIVALDLFSPSVMFFLFFCIFTNPKQMASVPMPKTNCI